MTAHKPHHQILKYSLANSLYLPNPNLQAIIIKKSFDIGQYRGPNAPLIRGKGNVWPITGYIAGEIADITQVRILVNQVEYNPDELFEVHTSIEGIDFFDALLEKGRIHFCFFMKSSYIKSEIATVEIDVYTGDTKVRQMLGEWPIQDDIDSTYTRAPIKDIAICMATYNPDIHQFARQITSIQNQEYKNWHLFIQDDHSDETTWQLMKQFIGHDTRITMSRSESNVGFYHNFERCIQQVSSDYHFIALADQDDVWHTDKLKVLRSEIGSAHLIYSDMMIAEEDGSIRHPTFWTNRSNHYSSIGTLVLSNTVTGAASLMDRHLLPYILPFPQKMGHVFHDHWIALVAAHTTGLRYVDDTLQTYVQHGRNVTGHEGFIKPELGKSALAYLSLQRIKLLTTSKAGQKKHKKFLYNNLKVYFDSYLRRKLQYHVILERMPYAHSARMDAIFGLSQGTIRELMKMHIEVIHNHWFTNNMELSYIKAIEVMRHLSLAHKVNQHD